MTNGDLFTYIMLGATLGLSAGISPGPLLTLVISESLKHGPGGGIKVALSPLITDLPIILASLLILARLGKSPAAVGIIATRIILAAAGIVAAGIVFATARVVAGHILGTALLVR